ncbi:MAG: VOC family protein [Alphaproteobacteria bacterium]
MMIGTKEKISDVCMVCRDLETLVAFYRDRMGFRLRRKAEGFADFQAENVTLALWEASHIAEHVGIPLGEAGTDHKVMVAVEVADPGRVDDRYRELVEAGVETYGPPKAYLWNAYAFYLADPEGNLWEVYTWVKPPEDYHETFTEG